MGAGSGNTGRQRRIQGVLAIWQCPTLNLERMKCLIFDDEMCTLPKVGGEDSKGRRVL